MEISLKINGRVFVADFVKSEEAGYRPGKLLLDMPNGDTISVYKSGRKWIEALISGGICRRSVTHSSRAAALESAATELAARTLDYESLA